MSGIELLRQMKAKALTIPVIRLTTFDDDAAPLFSRRCSIYPSQNPSQKFFSPRWE
jgi:DNA-binding NarL/FixJ family response regulator